MEKLHNYSDRLVDQKFDSFEIEHQKAKYTIEVSNGQLDRPDIVEMSQVLQGQCYVDYGYINESGLDEDGRMFDGLDSAREAGDDKLEVVYLLAHDKNKSLEDAGATIRLINVGKKGSIEDLPTYGYFDGRFTPEAKTKIDNIVNSYGIGAIREIAALGIKRYRDVFGSYELMRSIMQNSLMKSSLHGVREFYLASLTDKSFNSVVNFAGREAVEVLDDPVLIHPGDERQKEVYVTPVLMDPNKSLDGFLDEIEASNDENTIRKLANKIVFLTDGLSKNQINHRVSMFLDEIK